MYVHVCVSLYDVTHSDQLNRNWNRDFACRQGTKFLCSNQTYEGYNADYQSTDISLSKQCTNLYDCLERERKINRENSIKSSVVCQVQVIIQTTRGN